MMSSSYDLFEEEAMRKHCGIVFLIHLILFLSKIVLTQNTINVVCTTALIDAQNDKRKQEYINAIETIKQFGFEPYIVESCASSPSFLDDLTDNVWYAKTHNFMLRNKGVKEVNALLDFFNYTRFGNEHIIVKVTGRYFFVNNSFLRFVADHLEYDVFVKYLDGQVFTGCFAMKYKYLINFLESLNLKRMESEMISIERELAVYLALNKDLRICRLDNLSIVARIGYNDYINYL